MTVAAPTDQRAGTRPIAFVLDNRGRLSTPVILQIRPEDLSRTEPSRLSVHQTLAPSGAGPVGWVDDFGQGLPTINISGHTGWRTAVGSGMDGAAAFEDLNGLVTRDYHDARQSAVNSGLDPSQVRLVLVDTLDGFAYSVTPTQFVLRRNKSRPLLFQYQISLQVVSTSVGATPVIRPNYPTPANGIVSLRRTISSLAGWRPVLFDILPTELGGLGELVGGFIDLVTGVSNSVVSLVTGAQALATSAANRLIGFASDLASVGLSVFRAMNAVTNLPSNIQNQISRVAAAFNELVCIFANSLKPRPVYETYTGLYGASNCSSTSGGRPYSPYANLNVFSLIAERDGSISVSSEAMASIQALRNMDPVLSPMAPAEIERHLSVITGEVRA